MNFKSILVLGLGVATLGFSLPAHAGDTMTTVNSTQGAIVTGTKNITTQSNRSDVSNRQTGRKIGGNTDTSITSGQSADVQGKKNITGQVNSTSVNNYQRRTR
jgi:hypothetical protein